MPHTLALPPHTCLIQSTNGALVIRVQSTRGGRRIEGRGPQAAPSTSYRGTRGCLTRGCPTAPSPVSSSPHAAPSHAAPSSPRAVHTRLSHAPLLFPSHNLQHLGSPHHSPPPLERIRDRDGTCLSATEDCEPNASDCDQPMSANSTALDVRSHRCSF